MVCPDVRPATSKMSNTSFPNGKRDVRILLVGEDGVGKTSLILTLVTEEFPDAVPAKAEEIIVPPDVTAEHVLTHIVDFSAKEQSATALQDELKKASCICVVYAVDQPGTIERISTYWMPTIQETLGAEHGKPVILVGNKSDRSDDSTLEQILPIMNKYAEIETCVECSAKNLKNISEIFYYAQKAVVHPTGPLYLAEEKELTQVCKKALVRVFKICDRDNDGLLNDAELNDFQIRCFGTPLNPAALEDIKSVVRRNISEGVLDYALTLKGFLFLHTLFIQRGRQETTWTVLRRFGYDNSLQLSKEYLFPPLKVPLGCTTEVSMDGFQFLVGLFQKYDENKDDCLSPTELQNMFSVCPSLPWGPEVFNTVTTDSNGWITYEGYLSYWVLTTFLDCSRTLEYLAYLGYVTAQRNQLSAITVTRDKRVDWQRKETSRTVFQCHVIGSKDSGKTAFLQAFIGRDLKAQASINKRQLSHYTINSVKLAASHHSGDRKYILLHEIDVLSPEDVLSAYELSCDVVCLTYDVSNPNSFEYCARIYKKYFHRSRLPVLIVGTKADRHQIPQSSEFQPLQFCQQFRLPAPMFFSAVEPMAAAPIYQKLATLSVYPHMKKTYYMHDSAAWVKLSLGAAAAAVVGFVIYRNMP